MNTPEWIAIVLAGITAIGTALNVWMTNSIRADVAEMKVWALERFIDKADARSMVQTYLSQQNTQGRRWNRPQAN